MLELSEQNPLATAEPSLSRQSHADEDDQMQVFISPVASRSTVSALIIIHLALQVENMSWNDWSMPSRSRAISTSVVGRPSIVRRASQDYMAEHAPKKRELANAEKLALACCKFCLKKFTGFQIRKVNYWLNFILDFPCTVS
jgi:hypothetical protein